MASKRSSLFETDCNNNKQQNFYKQFYEDCGFRIKKQQPRPFLSEKNLEKLGMTNAMRGNKNIINKKDSIKTQNPVKLFPTSNNHDQILSKAVLRYKQEDTHESLVELID